jgi:soluble lytic murein transglycosylase-like protein
MALAFLLSASACTLFTPLQPNTGDALLALYRHEQFRPLVIDYYANLTKDRVVALAILETCDELELDPSLAFAMAWNESRFNPKAVNFNASSSDRGLFQLNSRTFSRLDRKTLFNPKANAQHGLAYYKMALERLGSEAKALGYYNSGIGLITERTLPRSTQAYVKRILEDRDRMDRDAIAWIYFSHDTRLALR